MGTRGAFGVRIDGQDKLMYNHFDSYPSGLGTEIVDYIQAGLVKGGNIEQLKTWARNLKLIDKDIPPTQEDIERLAEYTDLGVSGQSTSDWYCLTRKMQGDLQACLKAGYMLPANDFVNDSLFCEYAYIINLDDETLECYKGFQREPHQLGRYATNQLGKEYDYRKGSGSPDYYPVALVGTFPLTAIPENWMDIAYPRDDDDEDDE